MFIYFKLLHYYVSIVFMFFNTEIIICYVLKGFVMLKLEFLFFYKCFMSIIFYREFQFTAFILNDNFFIVRSRYQSVLGVGEDWTLCLLFNNKKLY